MKRSAPIALTTLVVLATSLAWSQPTESAQVSAALDQKLGVALATYREQSAQIAAEKVPLLREIHRLEAENIRLRENVEDSRTGTADDNNRFDALENRRGELKTQTEFAEKFLQEYLNGFEMRLNPAEDQLYKDQLTTLRETIADDGSNITQRLLRQLEAANIGLERLEHLLGGNITQGRAIDGTGAVRTGDIALIGPSAYFVSRDNQGSDLVGMLQHRSGTIEPEVVALAGEMGRGLKLLVDEGHGNLPLDVSMGNAVTVLESNVRLIDHVQRGGPVGYTILLLGAIALILSIIKLGDLGHFRTIESTAVGGIVRSARANQIDEALGQIGKVAGPVREMLELGVRNLHANTVLLEELMLSVILRRRPAMERFLPFLAITAAAAPLLGLLGTVVGMIRTFALITVFGTGDPRTLSAGISEALVTTELGLMVAIPTLILHGIFSRMIKRRFGDMERVAFEFVKNVSLEESKAVAN